MRHVRWREAGATPIADRATHGNHSFRVACVHPRYRRMIIPGLLIVLLVIVVVAAVVG
jgi:hypothetical protein